MHTKEASVMIKSPQEEPIEKKYEKAFAQAAGIQPIFPLKAKQEMANMVEERCKSEDIYSKIISSNQSPGIKGGRAAEVWHKETYNLDAMVKEKGSRAHIDMDMQVNSKGTSAWEESGLTNNDPATDIIITKHGKVKHKSQIKYHTNAEDSANNMALLNRKTRQPKYAENDSIIGPSDQIEGIKEYSHNKAIKESDKRPDVAEAHRMVEQKATDRLEHEGASSTPLTKKDADKIGTNKPRGKELKKQVRGKYQTQSTIKHMGKAAIGAAASSAIFSGVYNIYHYISLVQQGKISEDEAVIKIVGETVSSAADSAIKAAANTGIQSMVVRYGTKEIVSQAAKSGFKNMFKTNAVTTAVICSIDMAKDLVRLATGKITPQEFEERSGKGVLNTSAGIFGASIGSAAGAHMIQTSLSLGILGQVGIGALAGGMIGGLIAGIAMQFAIENHIEKPYRELVQNTETIRDSLKILQDVSSNILNGQIMFENFLRIEQAMNEEYMLIEQALEQSGKDMKRAIDRI